MHVHKHTPPSVTKREEPPTTKASHDPRRWGHIAGSTSERNKRYHTSRPRGTAPTTPLHVGDARPCGQSTGRQAATGAPGMDPACPARRRPGPAAAPRHRVTGDRRSARGPASVIPGTPSTGPSRTVPTEPTIVRHPASISQTDARTAKRVEEILAQAPPLTGRQRLCLAELLAGAATWPRPTTAEQAA